MSSSTLPLDRLAQEKSFIDIIRIVEENTNATSNAEKPAEAQKFAEAGKAIVDMIRSGFEANLGFKKPGLEHFTPIGLFNVLSKDLIPAKGVLNLEGLSPSVAVPAIESFVKTYKEVITSLLDVESKLVMHTLGNDPDMQDLQSTAGMMDIKDATFVGRCLRAGVEFNADAFSHLNRKQMVSMMQEATVVEHLKKLSTENPLIEDLNEINGLILLRPEELKEYLAGPGRQFLPDEVMNHAYHCAICDHSPPEAIEVWLQAGANVEGSGRHHFNKTALGSAIFASPLDVPKEAGNNPSGSGEVALTFGSLKQIASMGQLGVLDNESLSGLLSSPINEGAGAVPSNTQKPLVPTKPEARCVVEMLLQYGADVNPAGGQKSPLAQAYEKGNLVLIDLLEGKNALFKNETEKKEAYICCAEHGSNEAMEKMLYQGISINDIVSKTSTSSVTNKSIVNEHTALTMAAMMGKESTVDFCLTQGADPEIKVRRTVCLIDTDEKYDLNFLQEAIRLDQPKVLEVAIKHLGLERVLQEELPKSAVNCTDLLQGFKAAQAVNSLSQSAAPTL